MRILVLGAYGMLGHRVLRQLLPMHDVFGSCRKIDDRIPDAILPRHALIEGVDAMDLQSVRSCISRSAPDAIINCIGIVKQSELRSSSVMMIQVNSLFPHELAAIGLEAGSRIIHFSTDCVFSGRKGDYQPDELHDAQDPYGKTKSLGELSADEGVTIRSSIIGRELTTNHGLLEWFISNKGQTVKGYTRAIFSGLTTHEMSNVVSLVLEKKDLRGVLQVASRPISKYALLNQVRDRFQLDVGIEPYADFTCDRSLNGNAFFKKTSYVAPTWDRMIDAMADDWWRYDELRERLYERA